MKIIKSILEKDDGKIKAFDEAKKDVNFALDSKKAKKDALRAYLKLKKGEESFSKKEKIFENQFTYPLESIQNIKTAANGDILKPFENKTVYTVVKVVNKIDPQPLPFVEVRNDVLKAYRAMQKRKILLSQATERLKHFKGTNVKNISPEFTGTILSLNEEETRSFINQLFTSSQKEGMIKLEEKVVLYRINDSIITPVKNVDTAQIENLLKSTKQNELFAKLLEKLQTKYGVVSYMEKGE